MLAKVMKMHVLPTISQCGTSIGTFDLQMFRIDFDMLPLVINFINDDWVPYHVIVGLFEVPNTFRATLGK
jgi:hypothetical protein